MTTPDQQAFIDQIAADAIATQAAHGVPAPVTIAQAILESGWGRSILAVQGHALFGIKYGAKWSEATSPYVRGSISKDSGEFLSGAWTSMVSAFCRYDTWRDSILDHGLFMRRPVYTSVHHITDPDAYARAIHAAGYATDPGYADKITALMRTHNLYRYDQETIVPAFARKTIGIIHSQQPANQYAGAGTGITDSEQRWMRDLAREVAAELASTGHDVRLGPDGDASSTYRTNVTWANSQPLDALISLHSNATGKAGTTATGIGCYYVSTAGKRIAQALADRLRPASARGQASILTGLTVAELTSTKAPAVLVENEYHDWEGSPTTGGAAWLRDPGNRTQLAKAYRAAIVDLYGESTTGATIPTTVPPVSPVATKPTSLAEDGIYGRATITAMQRWVGANPDGIEGPRTRRALQAKLGVTPDTIIGRRTIEALQRLVGAKVDGAWPRGDARTSETTRKLQQYLNTLGTAL